MADQPLIDLVLRMLAHSLRLALPRMTTPAARKRAIAGESRCVILSLSASEPAVVGIASLVSMLSLIRIGMPCSGPRTPLDARSASNARASANAEGGSEQ